ncbi:MAG TPA: hypothetical protein VHP83_25640 [Aggregatilineaceae bacterium]|nr:hypothetical protein [Aggregatilineaceae bacterium]
MNDLAGLQLDDHKHEEGLEEDSVGLHQVTRPHICGTIAHEGGPDLPAGRKRGMHFRYFWIVRLLTWIPNFSSSPRIRSAPHSRFLSPIARSTGWSSPAA